MSPSLPARLRKGVALALSFFALFTPSGESAGTRPANIVVYGGNAAGIVAAVQAARLGQSVVLLEPGKFAGGMTTGGLGASDVGRQGTIGGIALEFYRSIFRHYQNAEAWKNETRDAYLPKHRLIYNKELGAQWFFEPHVADQVFREMLAANGVSVVFGARLDRKNGVSKRGGRIESIRMEDGTVYPGKMFIDATYEGDLLAAAGISYTVGREPNAQYQETLNGICFLDPKRTAHIDPYVKPGDSSSGLLPRIEPKPPGREGDGDRRVQAYTFRLCLTDDPKNRVPVAKPGGYDPLEYETVLRHLLANPQAKLGEFLFTLTPMPNRKTDSNNKNMFSTDWTGMSYDWAEASYAEREKLWQQHKAYVQGLLWFLANDERVPTSIRNEVARWGLARDEFVENGNWPHQLYVREARRMVGEYVVTEADCLRSRIAPDGVALSSYPMDSHLVGLFIDTEGRLRLEGTFFRKVDPYPVSYRALLPKRSECENLLAPVCVSASHAAYGSMRMEPVFMMLAQAAATAAALANQTGTPLHDLPYPVLKSRLVQDGIVLESPAPAANTDNAAGDAELAAAVEELAKLGVVEDPAYWVLNARKGKTCSREKIDGLLLRAAAKFSPADSVEAAVEILAANKVITSAGFWQELLQKGGPFPGHIAGFFLASLAKRLD